MNYTRHQYQDSTPSVYFNFDYSNQKTNQNGYDYSNIPYDYSTSTNKNKHTEQKQKQNNQQQNNQNMFVTPPPSYLRNNVCRNLLDNNNSMHLKQSQPKDYQVKMTKNKIEYVEGKMNTEEFFQDFDNNFVVNFGDSPMKNQPIAQFRRTFQSCPAQNGKSLISSKVGSHISEPLVRRVSNQDKYQQNEQQIVISQNPENKKQEKIESNGIIFNQKQNIPEQRLKQKELKINCQIRKRVLFKTTERITHRPTRKHQKPSKIINHENLMILTTNNWTDLPQNKKNCIQVLTQPVKICQKQLKKAQSNIFSTRQIFKQTLRSTTLDNWKKKFTIQRNQLDLKQKNRAHNIFQRPFSLIR